MSWCDDIKSRYAEKGWDAFRQAEEAFKRRIDMLCSEHDIVIVDHNPEGKDWMILLKDGTELYVECRSYDTLNPQNDFWVDYKKDQGVVVEFLNANSDLVGCHVVIPNEDISVVCDEW